MRRSSKIVVLCHCLLNANAKVRPLATYPAALPSTLHAYPAAGRFQLPCPETAFRGLNRWGMTREQYDQPAFRRHCRRLLEPCLDQIEALLRDGCVLQALVGVDGSPSCGMFRTCTGYRGGEISSPSTDAAGQVGGLAMVPGHGVFMEELLSMLKERGIDAPAMAVDEEAPDNLITS
jgi:predicted secreted protein